MGICLGNSCMYFSYTTSACFLRSRIGSRKTRGGWALTRLALLGTDGVGSCWTHLVCLLRKLFDGPSRTFSKLSSYRSPFREKSDDVPAAGRSRLSSAPSCARSLASDVHPGGGASVTSERAGMTAAQPRLDGISVADVTHGPPYCGGASTHSSQRQPL